MSSLCLEGFQVARVLKLLSQRLAVEALFEGLGVKEITSVRCCALTGLRRKGIKTGIACVNHLRHERRLKNSGDREGRAI